MEFVPSVLEVVRKLSGTVFVEDHPSGAVLVQSPEIPALLLMPVRGGRADARVPFAGRPSVVIWEDQWHHHFELLRGRLLSMFGQTARIHARQCSFVDLTQPQLNAFLKQHHLHLPTRAKTKLGLIKDDELKAVASFGKLCPVDRDGRTWKSVELIRFCNASGTTVVGGLSRFIKEYIRRHSPEDIMSYCDLEWSTGGSYTRLKFKPHGQTEAQEFWVEPNTRRRFYPHQRLDVLTAAGLETWSEAALLDRGWTQVFNRGSIKFILEVV